MRLSRSLNRFSCLASIAVLFLSHAAWAEPPVITPAITPSAPDADALSPKEPKASAPPRNYVSLTMGASTGSQGPVVCAEVAPLAMLAVAGCGNGSGVLHDTSLPEIAHFRATLTPLSWQLGEVWLQPRVSLGIAELQVGPDAAGFDFTGTGPTDVETAGPEAGAALRGLWPIYGGVEMVSELSLGLAYFSYAPELARPKAAWQPSATLTLGIGF
jgi:hypothetical protein